MKIYEARSNHDPAGSDNTACDNEQNRLLERDVKLKSLDSSARKGLVALLAGLALVLCSCGGSATSSGTNTVGKTSGQKSSSAFDLVTPGVLTVATTGDVRPLITVSSGAGKLGGMNGIILESFAKSEGLKIKLYKTTFDSAILAVEQGRVDVMPAIYYSSDRAKAIYYSEPNAILPLEVFVKKGVQYNGPNSLKGKSVAITQGQVWIPKVSSFFGSGMKLFPTNATAGKALLNGQVDAYLQSLSGSLNAPLAGNMSQVKHYQVHAGQFGLSNSDVANLTYVGTSCDNKALAQALDQHFDKLRQSGEWASELKKAGIPSGFQPPTYSAPAQGCS